MSFQMGEPVEVFISSAGMSKFYKASYIAAEDATTSLVKVEGRHLKVDNANVYALNKPSRIEICLECNNKAKWVDHGSSVGKYWWCDSCKKEVDSIDNTYGISASKHKKEKVSVGTRLKPLRCREPGPCLVCKGYNSLIPDEDIKIGMKVVCLNPIGTHLNDGGVYNVVNVKPLALVVRVLNKNTGALEEKEIRKCRFGVHV